MKLSINGEIKEANFTSLGEWAFAEFGCPAADVRGIALAINDKIVPKSKWDSCSLQTGDRILAVKATQGG